MNTPVWSAEEIEAFKRYWPDVERDVAARARAARRPDNQSRSDDAGRAQRPPWTERQMREFVAYFG